jgi:hypothetical protein
MHAFEVIAVFLLISVLAADIWVTIAVSRSVYYSRRQKKLQVCIVWLVPLVGALLVGVFLHSQRDNPMFDTRAYPEPSEKATPITIEASLHGHGHGD